MNKAKHLSTVTVFCDLCSMFFNSDEAVTQHKKQSHKGAVDRFHQEAIEEVEEFLTEKEPTK